MVGEEWDRYLCTLHKTCASYVLCLWTSCKYIYICFRNPLLVICLFADFNVVTFGQKLIQPLSFNWIYFRLFLFSPKNRLLQRHFPESHPNPRRKKSFLTRELPTTKICYSKMRPGRRKTWLHLHGSPTWRPVFWRATCSKDVCKVWSLKQM